MHQKQYYNSNFKDKDPDFNPGVSVITLMKVDENDDGQNLGSILVKTDEYVQDLRNLPGLGKRHMEEASEEEKRPDYPDVDGDGDTKEPMEKALKDKKK